MVSKSNNGGARPPSEFGLEAGSEWLHHIRAAVRAPDVGRIGPYDVVGEVMRGGQGIVYRARHGETGREVALKRLVHGAFSSPEACARFEREVLLAGSLEHPGIVRTFGVEVVDGQPVIAMEWIDGETVGAWAQNGGRVRQTDEVVRVLARICDAVHHAHQHGVLHRDLKPSNILVDAHEQPKVVDFGVAKSLEADRAPGLTASDEFVGTLAYAAPEQLRAGAHRLDVRADVYAIGVILYELLTQRRPHPSTDSLAQAVEAIEGGHIDRPSRIAAGVGYELDTIVMKALQSDPEMRYQSVDAMREDLRRLQRGQPILAHPPSAWYQLRKLVARNRLTVSLTAVVVALVASLAIVWWTESARVAHAQEREVEALRMADSVSNYIREVFIDLNPIQSDKPWSLAGVIVRAADRIDERFGESSPFRAKLRRTLGTVLFDLGHKEESIGVFRDCLRIREEIGDDPLQIGMARAMLADSLKFTGRFDEADALYRVAFDELSGVEAMTAAGHVLYSHAELEYLRARLPAALELADRSIEVLQEATGGEGRDYAFAISMRGTVLASQGMVEEAVEANEESVVLLRGVYGDKDSRVASGLVRLGTNALHAGMTERAEEALEEGVAIYVENLPDDHPNLALARVGLGSVRRMQGRLDDAEELLERGRAALEARGGADTRYLCHAVIELGYVATARGDFAAAQELFTKELELVRSHTPRHAYRVPKALVRLAGAIGGARLTELTPDVVTMDDDLLRAQELYAEAIEIQRTELGESEFPRAHMGLGKIAVAMGDLDGADRHYRDALEAARRIGEDETAKQAELSLREVERMVAEAGDADSKRE